MERAVVDATAGCLGALITTATLYPLDLLKTRVQVRGIRRRTLISSRIDYLSGREGSHVSFPGGRVGEGTMVAPWWSQLWSRARLSYTRRRGDGSPARGAPARAAAAAIL